MKILADFLELRKGSFIPELYALREDGKVDEYISYTLLDLISESPEDLLYELDKLLLDVQLQNYKPANAALPDWGMNDKSLWAMPPMAAQGMVAIFNENIPEFASDAGSAACFEISEVREVIRLWLLFLKRISLQGVGAMAKKSYEATTGDFDWSERLEPPGLCVN